MFVQGFSLRQPGDIVSVILCATLLVCARTSSSYKSLNTSGRVSKMDDLSNVQYRASFIDFILDPSLIKPDKSTYPLGQETEVRLFPPKRKSTQASSGIGKISAHQKSPCLLFANLLGTQQMKFCHRHQALLITILPQVIQLTHRQCARITSDLRWNCSAIDFLLDRSNPLAFTKEAALVRSILNAAMMYLVLRTCNGDSRHDSCGCLNQQNSDDFGDKISESIRQYRAREGSSPAQESGSNSAQEIPTSQPGFTQADLWKLDSGSPLRLTGSMIRDRACLANPAFAEAFTKVFIDSDDNKALNKAYKTLNDNKSYSNHIRRLAESDGKDLAYIKWSKSAINLHNNHVGRQLVRGAIQRRCRCHGLSGLCPFQTCWDQLPDFETISTRLRWIYLGHTARVEVKNVGSFDEPDLRLSPMEPMKLTKFDGQLPPLDGDPRYLLAENLSSPSDDQSNRLKPGQLIYRHDSPEYCEPLPKIKHPGTKGRLCNPKGSFVGQTNAMNENNSIGSGSLDEASRRKSSIDQTGSCEQLCCNRGCYRELVLDLVACNCRFKFCCEVRCDHCLRQKVQHFCL